MCWMCDQEAQWSRLLGDDRPTSHFSSASTTARSTGFAVTTQSAGLLVIGDSVPADSSTTFSLTVNASPIVGTLETVGDQDWFKVELEAGKSYEFGMYAKYGGPNGIPLADSLIEIIDSAGNSVATIDGGANTDHNLVFTGFDALGTFVPTASGTYFVNARSYDEIDGDAGDGKCVGDYELFVRMDSYVPLYSTDSPLHSIDWGSQVDRTSRNPDGAEGPRETGAEHTGTGWNPFGITGKNVITYYFAKQGDIFIDENPLTPGTTDTMVAKGFAQWEKDAYLDAFGAYSKVADLVYVEVQSRTEADFILITYDGTPGDAGPSLLGRMSPPGEENEGRTEFNANDVRWTEAGLAPGGFSFTTLIHEFGHGHGLAHPHDIGGRSSVMRGVVPTPLVRSPAEPIPDIDPILLPLDYTNGDFDLNQSVFTMMSYQDGWAKSPYGQPATTSGYGWLGSLMAFDIAVMQDKYGVNEEWATGNDTYVLRDVNAPGTFYECIWDAGGIDTIVYGGAQGANIDLRAATLNYEYGGGGWMSYAWGIHGGFTIANGVTIENATGGSGKDTLQGNDAANVLNGGAGDDRLIGAGGDDTLIGGVGRDFLEGGAGADLFLFASALESSVGGERDTILDFDRGEDMIDLTGAGGTQFIGAAAFSGVAGQVRYSAFDGGTIIELDRNGDRRADLQIALDEGMLLSASDFVGLDNAPLGGGFMF